MCSSKIETDIASILPMTDSLQTPISTPQVWDLAVGADSVPGSRREGFTREERYGASSAAALGQFYVGSIPICGPSLTDQTLYIYVRVCAYITRKLKFY